MKLRFANKTDIDEIMKVERDSFIPEIQEEKKLFLERIRLFSKGFVLLVDEEDDEKVSGYISCELWEKEPLSKDEYKIGHDIGKFHSDSGKILYISSFAVLSELRGKGVGKQFFKESLELICSEVDVEKILLMVNSEWLGAAHIYGQNGFVKQFEIAKIFPSADGKSTDGIVMKKII